MKRFCGLLFTNWRGLVSLWSYRRANVCSQIVYWRKISYQTTLSFLIPWFYASRAWFRPGLWYTRDILDIVYMLYSKNSEYERTNTTSRRFVLRIQGHRTYMYQSDLSISLSLSIWDYKCILVFLFLISKILITKDLDI